MKFNEKRIAVCTQPTGPEPVWNRIGRDESANPDGLTMAIADRELRNVLATFLTTLLIFGIFLLQGILVARILLPEGRGEFGTAMFFPRDVFLYVGLFGGIEIVNSYAVRGLVDVRSLKYSAAKVGLISGTVTAFFAATVSVIVMLLVGKNYLIPYCLLCCVFVPFEHMQLTISAVDRGNKNYRFYNINRLLYALTFLVLMVAVFGLNLDNLMGVSPLPLVCGLYVLARIVGLAPTLRGMDVWNSMFGSKLDPEVIENQKIALRHPHPVPAESEVPGAWTLLKNGRFYALSMLASEMFERMDMFLIVAIASVTESGFYFVAVPAAQLLIIAPNAMGVFTFNAGADRARRISLKKVVSVMAGTAVLQIVSAAILSLLIPYLIILFYQADYEPAIPFALWLLPACAIKGYLQAVDGYLKGRGKPMVGVRARLLSIFVMLGFVAGVYGGLIHGFEQKLLSIPVSACLGQAISMVLISAAVIFDAIEREKEQELEQQEVEHVDH